jgi:hypothetical protein
VIRWLLACRDPGTTGDDTARPPVDPPPTADTAPDPTGAPHTGTTPELVTSLHVQRGAFTDGGELCVLADARTDYVWSRYGAPPGPPAAYWIPVGAVVPQPEPREPLPDLGGVHDVAPGPDDTCFVAVAHRERPASSLLAFTRDGSIDARFGRIDLPDDTWVTTLTRDGDGLWVAGSDAEGGWIRRYDRDGALDRSVGVVRLPATPNEVRAVPDGFVFATRTRPGALWRTDRQGRPRADWGIDGRVEVPEDRFLQGVLVDLDDDGDALFVNQAADDGLSFHVLRPIGADGVPGPVTRLPDAVYDVRWDGDGQLWIEAGRVTRRAADGTEDLAFGVAGVVSLPTEDGGRDFYRGTTGTAALFATWWDPLGDWTTLRISSTP